ncbi:Mpv17 / PMP22 family protein [Nitzschia inconspicua]|uniref:Mpv17 / PMP22 family protein n=1 Tax=Nitzschia inconspicua TaxID=303405 RepID=A0A9K3LNK1_9STRA|nr:Mpv17 / PMP22 family protein [Nitzschia inconspicua]
MVVPAATTVFGRLWERYTLALVARPLFVKGSTASFIFFVSDSITQQLSTSRDNHQNTYDLARAGSGAVFGVVATGWLHYWWNFLEVAVGKRIPVVTHRFTNTVTKVAIDQLVGAPIYIFTYYVITHGGKEYIASLQESNSIKPTPSTLLRETCNRAAEMLPPTMLRHWTLWPAVHTLNFYNNPLHHRVLVQNLVLVGWSAYLSHLNNGGLLMTPTEEMEVAETVEIIRRESMGSSSSGPVTHAEIHIKGGGRATPMAASRE